MDIHPEGAMYPPVLLRDQVVPDHILSRRDAVSFCSSSSYFTVPRFERRGGISYEKTDKDAIYVRTLGDVRMRVNIPTSGGPKSAILESEHRVLEKLTLPDYKLRFRSRFLSLHKVHRRRRPIVKVVGENRSLLDTHYGRQAQCLLSEIGNWDFNVFSMDTLSGGRALFHVAFQIFQEYDLVKCFHLDTLKLMRCLSLLESGYHDNNPYHNAVHAADVTQAMHCYLQEPKLRNCVSPLEIMATFIGAMSHDLDHPGVNNAFLIATANHLASLYNNSSVLENHHWRSAVGVLQETRLFHHLPRTQWNSIVELIKQLILATDITRQQEFLLKFRRHLDEDEFDYVKKPENRHFVLQIALKCADICSPGRKWSLSRMWSEKVVEEFFKQGDSERALQIPVTPLCNKKSNTVAKIQVGFFEYVANPLFMEWYRFLPSKLSRRMLDNITTNKANWKKIIDEEAFQVQESDSSSSRNEEHSNDGQGVSEEEEEEEDEEVEGHSEEDDVVENDINLAYQYDSEQMSESGRSLSPVSEEAAVFAAGSRRHSMPPVFIRRDLNFYLGMRRDSSPRIPLLRRRSLPTTTLFKTTSADVSSSPATVKEVRSLSMEALMSRPKLTNLSPSIEASRLASGLEYLNFVPLKNQTLVLQRGSITKFTSSQRTINSLSDITFHSNRPTDRDDLRLQSLKHDKNLPSVGLASSWPTISPKSKIITNGIRGMKVQADISKLAQKENEPGADNSNVSSYSPPICLSKNEEAGPGRPH